MLRLLLASPWRRAPLLALRQPAVALATAITVGLLGLAAASYPLYLASSGSGALAVEISQRCPDGLDASVTGSGAVTGVPAVTSELERRSNAALLAAGATKSDLQSSIITLDATGLGLQIAGKSGRQARVQLASRTNGLQNITVLSSVPGPGIWLSNDLAQNIGAKPGTEISLGQDSPDQGPVPTSSSAVAEVRVAGIYTSLVGTVLPRFWCSETSIFGTPDQGFPPPPVVLAPQITLISLLNTIKVRDLSSYQWERTLSPGLNVPEATRVLRGLNRLTGSIGVELPLPGTRLPPIAGGISGSALVDNQLTFIIAHAEAIETALRSGILPVSIAGIAISGLLVAVAGSYWVDRRRSEVVLLSSRGAGPGSLGLKAALESVIPVVLGVLAGWLAALGLVSAIGPSAALPPVSLLDALWSVLAAAGFALALVGVVASLRIRGHAESSSGSPRVGSRLTQLPVELVGLGLAIWAWSTLGHQSLAAQGTSAPGVGAEFLAFPILFVLSLAALAARLTVIVLRSRRFRTSTAKFVKPVWLASRRLSGAPFIAAVSLGSTAAAIGVLVYASALTNSQDATLHAKAALFVGSTTSVQLVTPGSLPGSLASDSTELLGFSNAELNGQQVDVIGVDPSTFARGAFWDRSFADESLNSLLSQLTTFATSGSLPVIVAGDGQQSGNESLQLPTYGGFVTPIQAHVVATAFEFPGENSPTPLVVTTASELQRLDDQGTNIVWSKEPEGEVLSDLSRARLASSIVISTGNVLDQTTFAAISWTFAYLQALGVLSGAVIVGGLLLFVTTRASQRALAYVLSRRMGLRRGTHFSSLVMELGVMLAPGAVLGGLFGWFAVELAASHLDPLPALRPPPLLEIPYVTMAVAAGATLLVWAAVSSWAQHVTDRSRASELLRADA